MRSSGVKGTVWTSEDQSEVKKFSRRLILRGQILSDHVDWPPCGLCSTSTLLMLTPIAQAHNSVRRDLGRSKSNVSVA